MCSWWEMRKCIIVCQNEQISIGYMFCLSTRGAHWAGIGPADMNMNLSQTAYQHSKMYGKKICTRL